MTDDLRSSKVREICTRLEKLARSLGAGAQMPTFLVLCEEMGVSKATLALALAQMERDNVLQRRHGVGIFVAPDLRCQVALVCSARFAPGAPVQEYWRLIVDEAMHRAAARGYSVSLHFAHWENEETHGEPQAALQAAPLQDDLVEKVRAGRVQGVLGVALSDAAAKWLGSRGVPVVSFAGFAPHMVGLNGRKIVEMGAQALTERGCRHLALWRLARDEEARAASTSSKSAKIAKATKAKSAPLEDEEVALFRRSLRHGAAFSREHFSDDIWKTHEMERQLSDETKHQRDARRSHFEQGYEDAHRVFSQPRASWPDGVLLTNDEMTHGALSAWQKLGVRVPGDVLVATHANRGSWVLRSAADTLILLEYDPAELVQSLFETLEGVMRGEARPALHEIEPQLVVGDVVPMNAPTEKIAAVRPQARVKTTK